MQSALRNALEVHRGRELTAERIDEIIRAVTPRPSPIDLSGIRPKFYGEYTFHVERYGHALEELMPLHRLHWAETEKYRHGLPLNPDYERFLALERAGRLMLFTIRKNGELVGHTTMKLFESMHTQTIVAEEDSLFLREDCRGGWKILRFIDYAATYLGRQGAREVRVSAKLSNRANKLLERVGFLPTAMMMVKMIEVPNV